jgi:hypothetical protein
VARRAGDIASSKLSQGVGEHDCGVEWTTVAWRGEWDWSGGGPNLEREAIMKSSKSITPRARPAAAITPMLIGLRSRQFASDFRFRPVGSWLVIPKPEHWTPFTFEHEPDGGEAT